MANLSIKDTKEAFNDPEVPSFQASNTAQNRGGKSPLLPVQEVAPNSTRSGSSIARSKPRPKTAVMSSEKTGERSEQPSRIDSQYMEELNKNHLQSAIKALNEKLKFF